MNFKFEEIWFKPTKILMMQVITENRDFDFGFGFGFITMKFVH